MCFISAVVTELKCCNMLSFHVVRSDVYADFITYLWLRSTFFAEEPCTYSQIIILYCCGVSFFLSTKSVVDYNAHNQMRFIFVLLFVRNKKIKCTYTMFQTHTL